MQKHNLKPGSRQTTEYQLTDTISLVTFLDDSCTARYILVDKTKQYGKQTYAKFTDNRPFQITDFQNCLFKIDIKTGQLSIGNQAGNMYSPIGPRPINKTLTYVDENSGIHCLDLTQGCNSLIADYNLKKIFTTKLSPYIYEAEKYKILSALIALDRYGHGMKQKLNLNVHPYFISSYKTFLEYMIWLNPELGIKLLPICSQYGSYDKTASKEIIDVIRKEREKLNNNQIYYGNNQNKNNNNNFYTSQNNNFNNNNLQRKALFNQQNFQQQFTTSENQFLNNIQQFYSNMFGDKYSIICKCYNGNVQKLSEIQNFRNKNKDNINALNEFYNEKYAKHWIQQHDVNFWKQLVSKCNQNYSIIDTLSKFLEYTNCKYLKLFLERPLVALNQQQKMKIIQETFDQNDLKPLSQYKSFFYDYYSDTTCFLKFLFWYAQQQDLPNNPNVTTLAGLLGNYFPSEFKKNRCNSLLNLNNGNQLAGNDKILAYYIGYILFSNYTNTQGESYMLQQIQNIFPYLSKYGYETTFVIDGYKQQYVFDSGSKGYVLKNIPFGRYFKIPGSEKVGVTDWFPGAKPILVGGVEICQPKPVDEDVKECLEKLSEGGINELPKEGYEYTTENEVTTIKKGDKLIFEGKLNKDGKGFTEGTLVIII